MIVKINDESCRHIVISSVNISEFLVSREKKPVIKGPDNEWFFLFIMDLCYSWLLHQTKKKLILYNEHKLFLELSNSKKQNRIMVARRRREWWVVFILRRRNAVDGRWWGHDVNVLNALELVHLKIVKIVNFINK